MEAGECCDIGEVSGESKREGGAELEVVALSGELVGACAEVRELCRVGACADASIAEEIAGAQGFDERGAFVGDRVELSCGVGDGAIAFFFVEGGVE